MHSRNALLQRLRSLTRKVGVAVTVLMGVFAGLAAAGNSGHHRRATPAPTRPRPGRTNPARAARAPAPPSLPPLGADGSDGQAAQSPTPPAEPPVQTSQPPVAVSGGS